MENISNPYLSPTADGDPNAIFPAEAHALDFVPIMRRWDTLRLYYNGILACLVILVTVLGYPTKAMVPFFWISTVIGGFVANLCFLTGPAIEAYGTHFRIWNRALTYLLFLAGLGFTAVLAILSVANF